MLDNFFELNKCNNLKRFSSVNDFAQHFENSTSLQHAELPQAAHVQEQGFKDVEFKNVRLSHATFERVTFTRCIFEDCLLVGTRFIECEFHKCKFVNCNTHKINLKDVYIDPRSFHLHKDYRNTHPAMGMMRGGAAVATVTFLDPFYYCMLLITTLGFSEIIPTTPIGKAFAVGCALGGLSWMGLFTAILVRRVIR